MAKTSAALTADLALIGASLLWGSSFLAMKVAVNTFDPLLVILARMVMGSLVFLPMMRRFRNMRAQYRKGDVWRILAMALCEPGLYFTCEAYALRFTSASQAGMVTAMLPIMVAAMAGLVLGEKVKPRAWLGLAMAGAGVIWLSASGRVDESAPNPMLGNLLEFTAMGFATGYMILLKTLTPRYSPWFLTATQSFVGMLYFLPALFLPWTTFPTELDPLAVACVLYLGFIVTIGGYGLYNYGLSRTQASRGSAYINLIPVFSVLMGWFILGERFTAFQVAASLLVFAGVFLSRRRGEDAPVEVTVTPDA